MATGTNSMDREEALALLEPNLGDQLLGGLKINSDAVRHTLGTLVVDPISVEPVTDYITDIDERYRLFAEVQRVFWDYNIPPEVNATMVGLVMVAPIPEIKERILGIPPVHLIGMNAMAPFAVRSCGCQAEPAAHAKVRDGHACLFAGTSDPAAAQIFPFMTSAKRHFYGLNQLLQVFWGADKAMAWRRRYENADVIQSAQNYISMNHQLHFWFDNARFALKPLRRTQSEIVVQFQWLRDTLLKPRTKIKRDLDVLVQAGLTDHRSWGANLAHRRSGAPTQTGQTFVIRTEDPEDLPSFELLGLQWNLLRVAAMCGAGDATDEGYEKDEEEDYEDLRLDD